MEYEQKFKEALKVMESLYNVVKYQSSPDASLTAQTIEKAFPELRDSEDEMIRKMLIRIYKKADIGGEIFGEGITYKQVIAWLEKQGEQKLSWSEEDESGLGDALWAINQARSIAKDENDMGNLWYAENWLKSLKNRVQPQTKQEWSNDESFHYSNEEINNACLEMAAWKDEQLKQTREDAKSLHDEISDCIDRLVKSRLSKNGIGESNALQQMESIMVKTQQFLQTI